MARTVIYSREQTQKDGLSIKYRDERGVRKEHRFNTRLEMEIWIARYYSEDLKILAASREVINFINGG